MKTLLTLTAALIGGIALPTLLLAGPTENITGCATAAVEGANYTVRVDPTCALAVNKDGDPILMLVASAAFADALTPDEEEAE